MIPPRAHRRPARSRRQVAAELHEAVGVGSNRQEAIDKALQAGGVPGVRRDPVPGPDVDRRRLAVLDFEIDEVHLYGAGGEREQRTGGGAARRGETRTRVLAAAQVRFSVLAVATRQVKWSSAVELEQVAEEDLWPEQLAEAVLDEAAPASPTS